MLRRYVWANGFSALWESLGDVEEYFETIGLESVEDLGERAGVVDSHTRGEGLWVLTAEWNIELVEQAIADGDDGWGWLRCWSLRRLTDEEASRLAKGLPPFEGGAYL